LRSLPFSPDEFLNAIHAAATQSDHASPDRKGGVFCLLATVPPPRPCREPIHKAPPLGHVVIPGDFEQNQPLRLINGLARYLLEEKSLPVAGRLSSTKFVLGQILDRVFHWTGGHPYLTQKLSCAAVQSVRSQLSRIDDITPAQCHHLVDCLSERLFTS